MNKVTARGGFIFISKIAKIYYKIEIIKMSSIYI